MDGHRPLPRLPKRAACLLATLVAVGSAMACATSAGAVDDAADPSVRWPVDGPAMQAALAIAKDHWGMAPCDDHVTLAWEDIDPSLDAQAVWANDSGPYSDPIHNSGCEISFNPRGQWDWPKLCTITVHELGHLAGRDHVDDPDDVMYYTYMRPIEACASTPEPLAAAPQAPPPAPPPSATKPRRGSHATAEAAGRRRAAAKLRRARRAPAKRHRGTAAKRRTGHRA